MQINKVNTVTCTTDTQDGHKSGTVRSLWSQPILHGASRVFSDDHPHLLAQRCGPMHSCWPLSTKAVVLVQCNPLVPCCKTLAAASCMHAWSASLYTAKLADVSTTSGTANNGYMHSCRKIGNQNCAPSAVQHTCVVLQDTCMGECKS